MVFMKWRPFCTGVDELSLKKYGGSNFKSVSKHMLWIWLHSWAPLAIWLFGECHRIRLMIPQHWFWHHMVLLGQNKLTHWGRVTHICVSDLTIIGSDNGLSPGRRQTIIWTNAGILLIGPIGTNFSEILIEIQTFSSNKMNLEMASAKWRPFCLGLNVLNMTSENKKTNKKTQYFKQFHQSDCPSICRRCGFCKVIYTGSCSIGNLCQS